MAQAVLDLLDEQGIDSRRHRRAFDGRLRDVGAVPAGARRFTAMVLADTRATADNDQQREGRRKMIETVRTKGAAAVADEMLPKLLGASSQRDRPVLAVDVREMIERNRPEAIAGAVEAMMGRPDSRPLLGQVAVPTLVICRRGGRDDPARRLEGPATTASAAPAW